MSIWTSKSVQACTLLGAGLFLFGCSGGGAPYAGPPRDVDTEIAVTSDRLVVTGPDGFCIDPAATQDRGISAFVLLGNCAAIGNSPRLPQPEHPSILTAAISEAGPEGSLRSNIPAMAAFFTSEQGRGLLSRDQDPNSVEILDMFHQGDVFFLNARDSSASSIRGVKEDYWRVYMDVGNRIATLSVLALEDSNLTEAQSLETLRAFAGQIATANNQTSLQPAILAEAEPTPLPDGPYDSDQATAQSGDGSGSSAPTRPTTRTVSPARAARTVVRTLDTVGLLRRLFN